MNTEFFQTFERGTAPAGYGLGKRIVESAGSQKRSFGSELGKWEMMISFFKHTFEVSLCVEPENQSVKSQHRVLLCGMMSMGEMLAHESAENPELVGTVGYEKGFIQSNLRYLRDTYRCWYGEVDAEFVNSAEKSIFDALSKPDSGSTRVAP